MKPHTARILKTLADGQFHSGVALARGAGVTRATVWNVVGELEAMGLAVARVHGRGYRLTAPLSLLDRGEIERELGQHAPRFAVELHAIAASTNSLALERAAQGATSGTVVAAEWQSAGRGRRGRPWRASLAGGLTYSLLWRYEKGAGSLSGLSLAVGVALARALLAHAGVDVALKWPNDLMAGGRKLGGILIEIVGDALGPGAAVIGVGLNVRLPWPLRSAIDQPVTDLETLTGAAVERNALLARLLVGMDDVLEHFAKDGFGPFRAEWQSRHAHQGRAVELALPDGRTERGIAQGVAEDGSLLLETAAGTQRFHSGEIGLRAARR